MPVIKYKYFGLLKEDILTIEGPDMTVGDFKKAMMVKHGIDPKLNFITIEDEKTKNG